MEAPLIPLRYAYLIIRFTHNTLTEAEKDELDEWVCESDENMQLFVELTETVDDHILTDDDVIIATEDEGMNWVVVSLIVQYFRGQLSDERQQQLFVWARQYGISRTMFTRPTAGRDVAGTLLALMRKVKGKSVS